MGFSFCYYEERMIKMNLNEYTEKPFVHFAEDWAILTAGVPDDFNSMTVSWGALGTMWGMPVAFLVVRPIRYTCEFIERHEKLTLSWYDEKHKKALGIFGSKSGRDTDKAAATGFTPVTLEGAVTYKEAKETMVLRKLFVQQLDRSKFSQEILKWYAEGTKEEHAHKLIIAEVLSHHEGV